MVADYMFLKHTKVVVQAFQSSA